MKSNNIASDLKASLVVFLVALPLCLGIALASQAPLSAGIIAGVVGGILIGLCSGSHVSVSGPAAGLTVIVAMGIQQLGSFQLFCVAVSIAGLMQIGMGLIRAGNLGEYFPTAVIKGMLAAIGVILIAKQWRLAIGFVDGQIQVGPLVLSILTFSCLLGWEKLAQSKRTIFKLIPGPLVAVILCVVVNQIFLLVGEEQRVNLPKQLWQSMGFETIPFSWVLIKVSLTIAVVASLETLLCMDAAEKLDPLKRRPSKNRELFAQGIGNTVSGFLGGLPLTSVIVRTTANITSGGTSRWSAVMHGVWLLVLVVLVPNLLNLIPLATLSSILILLGYKLARPAQIIEMKQRGSSQLLVFLVTVISIVATDLLVGIFLGFFFALILEIKKLSLKAIDIEISNDHIHVKMIKNVSFLYRSKMVKILENDEHKHKKVKISGMKNVKIHIDIHDMLLDFKKESEKRGITFHLE
jgi:MFS superfamily sulfate permease-like transporter